MTTETSEAPEYFAELGERARTDALWIAKSLVNVGVEAEKSMRIAICTAKRLSEPDRRFAFSSTKLPCKRSWSSQIPLQGFASEGGYEPPEVKNAATA